MMALNALLMHVAPLSVDDRSLFLLQQFSFAKWSKLVNRTNTHTQQRENCLCCQGYLIMMMMVMGGCLTCNEMNNNKPSHTPPNKRPRGSWCTI